MIMMMVVVVENGETIYKGQHGAFRTNKNILSKIAVQVSF